MGAQGAQGQVKLRGQEEDEKAVHEGHLSPEEAEADAHGHQGDADRGEELQGQGGQEGHPQDLQGGLAVVLGQAFQDLGLAPGGAQQLEGGESLEGLQGAGREAGQTATGAD